MTTADDLPDDVVERAREAWGYSRNMWASYRLAALLDAGIVALVPDPDADAMQAVRDGWLYPVDANTLVKRLHAAGWTVAPTVDVRRREPCPTCHGDGKVPTCRWDDDQHDAYEADGGCDHHPCDECGGIGQIVAGGPDCPACKGTGERPADPQHDTATPRPSGNSLSRGEPSAPQGTGATATVPPPAGDPQHDHDSPVHPVDLLVSEPSTSGVAGRPGDSRPVTPPPAGDLPGDGWVRYRDDGGSVGLLRTTGAWISTGFHPQRDALDLRPDPDPEPEPRPTDGWLLNIRDVGPDARVRIDSSEVWYWGWSLPKGPSMCTGLAFTREEAEQAAAQARAAWDARLTGGAS